jgi:autotransporter strand-loop-strand O-heptosyltransferase|tara:strand:+ start:5439 stop:7724 length:2286 start_codon:yes stop_codon:yes gene_type:complete
MKIQAHTSFIGTTGYANHAQSFFTELDKLIPIKVRNATVGKSWNWPNNTPHDKEPYITPQMKKMLHLQTLFEADKSRNDYPIYHHKENFQSDIDIILEEHDHHYFYDSYNGYKIGYNVWESTKYSNQFFNQLLTLDELWVPTEWQKEISIKQGYPENKIFVIPEGVDGKIFKPNPKLKKQDKFQFIIVGRWDYRKGIKESIEGFLKAFPDNQDIELLLNVENPYPTDDMNSTEERLKYHGLEDNRIKILKFLNRKQYIKLLQNANVLISCAKAEGWNLPLIESLACGTPSIYTKCSGQLEFTKSKGLGVEILGEEKAGKNIPGNFYTPDLDDLVEKIKDSYNNYNVWKKWHLDRSKEIREEYSWKNQAKKAYNRLQQIKITPKTKTPRLDVNFVDGPYACLRNSNQEYLVDFINQDTNQSEYSVNLKNDHWGKTFHKFFINWDIQVKDNFGEVIYSHKYNASGKRVYIAFGSKALGDTLAWFPYALEFKKKHNCHVIVSTFWNKFFKEKYPELEFVSPGATVPNLYAMYEIGWYYDDNDNLEGFKQPYDPKQFPLQQTATNILGLEYKEIIPKINYQVKDRPFKEKYICISPHASASAKYWHHPEGWQTIINYINNVLGYKVVMISKEKYNDNWETDKLPLQKKFTNIIDATGDHPIEDIINMLHHSEMYIGVSSGLAWLSWSIKNPVVLISGFSSDWTEFTSNIERIINKNVCNSCFNNFKLDAGDWNWCPVHKDTPRQFECTKKILPETVIEGITRRLS